MHTSAKNLNPSRQAIGQTVEAHNGRLAVVRTNADVQRLLAQYRR